MRWLVPEVIQTSALDCGPAALKALLDGLGLSINLGRLREVCQTNIDGTSIDALEEVARRLGLGAIQTILPFDYLALPETGALPALVITQRPSGARHFVVVWRAVGPFLQVMDPAVGRRWISRAQLERELYHHECAVPAAEWRAWAENDAFLRPLRRRLADLGCRANGTRLVDAALAAPGWRPLAALDAAARMVHVAVRGGGIKRGAIAERAVEALARRSSELDDNEPAVPWSYWFARSEPKVSAARHDQVLLTGAVAVTVEPTREPVSDEEALAAVNGLLWSEELRSSLQQPETPFWRVLARILTAEGMRAPAMLVAASVTVALTTAVEALMLRGVFDLVSFLVLPAQRVAALVVLVLFLLVATAIETPLVLVAQRLGRHLEVRLRLTFLDRLPRFKDTYFRSRATSDLAERAHNIHRVRQLAELLVDLVRATCELLVTTLGLLWLAPSSAMPVLTMTALIIALPLIAQRTLSERELALRVHNAGLGRFYVDALLGAAPLRAHSAERALEREHESLLVHWMAAGRGFFGVSAWLEGAQTLVGAALAAVLVTRYAHSADEPGAVLLFVFWVLQLSSSGRTFASALGQFPALRNAILRLLEPLGAVADGDTPAAAPSVTLGRLVPAIQSRKPRGVAIDLDRVDVHAAGTHILKAIQLCIEPGSHVAVVGESGSGKSTLLGLLLGFYRATTGSVCVDGRALDEPNLTVLRAVTAWVDPAVHLWNESLIDNLYYGHNPAMVASLASLVDQAELQSLLENLPEGAQTTLGEGGGLVSGGEGQRVRFGRAFLRTDARLVLLDEPFRGLDRGQRASLLRRARAQWEDRTLVCVTHDIRETLAFDRVLVIADGRICEDGAPTDLYSKPLSRYRQLLESERSAEHLLWSTDNFRRVTLVDGRLQPDTSDESAEVEAVSIGCQRQPAGAEQKS